MTSKDTLTVGLLGATGRAGGWVLEACLEKGYEVIALARTPEKLSAYADKITIVQGDATTVEGIEKLLTVKDKPSVDVIVSAVGSPSKEVLIVKKTAEALTTVLGKKAAEDIPRIVWMTSTGVNEATDQAKSYPLFGKPSRWFFGYGGFGWLQFQILIPYVIGQDLWDDMGYSEDVLRAHEPILAKTVIVRPGNMWPVSEHATFSDEWRKEGGEDFDYVLVGADDPPPGKWIFRRAIAAAMMDLMTDTSRDGTAVSLFQK